VDKLGWPVLAIFSYEVLLRSVGSVLLANQHVPSERIEVGNSYRFRGPVENKAVLSTKLPVAVDHG
jgi:hypothetical protein